jgi:hypothetical protein
MDDDEYRQRSAAVMYVEARYRCAVGILDYAREGRLESDWRERLVTQSRRRAENAVLQTYVDVDRLVVNEVAGLPRRPWEPYAAHGDWRAALDAWYEDRLALETSYETAARQGLVKLDPGESESGWWQRQQRYRDCIGASYRAGLAAGGEPIDWLGWYKQRIRLREETDPFRIRHRERTLANVDSSRAWMQLLPDCWTRSTS